MERQPHNSLQLFISSPVESITAHVLGSYTHARLYAPGTEPRELPVYKVEEGTGVDIDKIDTLATVVFE